MNNNKTLIFCSSFLLLVFFIYNLSAQPMPTWTTPRDTILVEIDGSYITSRDLQDRINSLPSGQRPRFRTIDGQRLMLETMINEQVFYKRAVELGIDQLRFVQNAIYSNSQNATIQIYIEDAYKKELDFNPSNIEIYFHEDIDFGTPAPRAMIQYLPINQEDNHLLDNPADVVIIEREDVLRNEMPLESETRIHFFRRSDFESVINMPFEDLRREIESALIRQRSRELYFSNIEKLMQEYEVEIRHDLLGHVGVGVFRLPGVFGGTDHLRASSITVPEELRDTYAVLSPHSEIKMTLGEIENILRDAASRDLLLNEFDTPEFREAIILSEIDERLIKKAINNENTFENFSNRAELRQVRQDTVLEFFTDIEIDSKIQISREDLYEFYLNNPQEHTIPEKRLFRQFVSIDARAARRHHRVISRMFRQNQLDLIPEYTSRESLFGIDGGLIDISKGDNSIATLGHDQNYINKIFEANIGQLSGIFQNIYDEYVFFYVVEIIPESLKPFDEVRNSFIGAIHGQKRAAILEQKQDELREFYNVIPYPDRIVNNITAEELFHHVELARSRGEINESFAFLDIIITDFIGTEYAYEALFLKGFIAAENFYFNDIAVRAFREMIEKFPDGDLNNYAIYMLEALQNN